MPIKHLLLAATTIAALGAFAPGAQAAPIKSIVLVHGAFVDGSGWKSVYEILKKDGYKVSIVQNPTESLEDDVAAARRVIDAQDGNVLLVGHSYGGAVITEAATIPRSRASSMSRRSPPTRENRSAISAPGRRPTARSRRSCRRMTAISRSTPPSSRRPSRPMSTRASRP